MKTKLLELIDFKKVETLFEGFYKTTGFVTAILDLEGNVLSKSGWRQICTDFHRIHPEAANILPTCFRVSSFLKNLKLPFLKNRQRGMALMKRNTLMHSAKYPLFRRKR